MKVYAVELPLAPCARMINGGTTMRSISWGRLEAERWSVFLYWTLHSHSKPWPGLQWFITGAVFWSLTFSTLPWLQKSGFHCQLKSRKRDPFTIQNMNPKKRMGSLMMVFKTVFVSNKDYVLTLRRKNIIHSWTFTAFLLSWNRGTKSVLNKFWRGTGGKTSAPNICVDVWWKRQENNLLLFLKH